MEVVIDIAPTGRTEAMHFDEAPITHLGKAQIERASEIVFNPDTQQWDVVLPQQEQPFNSCRGFTGYDVARQFEVTWLQACRKQGIDPYSPESAELASSLR